MKNLKRIGLYGISGAGKTTILKELNALVPDLVFLEGSKLITNTANLPLRDFKKLPAKKKYIIRERAIDRAFDIQLKENKHIIIDCHLIFLNEKKEFENIMTKNDTNFYTDYIYLKLPPEIVLSRHRNDQNRKRYYSIDTILNWMEFELQELKCFCSNNKKKLHILEMIDNKKCVDFICHNIGI